MFEEIGVFYRGLVLGLMISAPVGPIGLLCIRRTIQRGFIVGLFTGLGAASADTIFAIVAALGVSAILEFMKHYDAVIRIVGGGIMLIGAWHAWHDKPAPPPALVPLAEKVVSLTKDDTLLGSVKAYISGFAITLTNPVTIVAVLAVIATFGNLQSRLDAETLIGGVFFGAALWWFMLSGGMSLLRHHCNEDRIVWINRITAVILAALAVWAILTGAKHFLPISGL